MNYRDIIKMNKEELINTFNLDAFGDIEFKETDSETEVAEKLLDVAGYVEYPDIFGILNALGMKKIPCVKEAKTEYYREWDDRYNEGFYDALYGREDDDDYDDDYDDYDDTESESLWYRIGYNDSYAYDCGAADS